MSDEDKDKKTYEEKIKELELREANLKKAEDFAKAKIMSLKEDLQFAKDIKKTGIKSIGDFSKVLKNTEKTEEKPTEEVDMDKKELLEILAENNKSILAEVKKEISGVAAPVNAMAIEGNVKTMLEKNVSKEKSPFLYNYMKKNPEKIVKHFTTQLSQTPAEKIEEELKKGVEIENHSLEQSAQDQGVDDLIRKEVLGEKTEEEKAKEEETKKQEDNQMKDADGGQEMSLDSSKTESTGGEGTPESSEEKKLAKMTDSQRMEHWHKKAAALTEKQKTG